MTIREETMKPRELFKFRRNFWLCVLALAAGYATSKGSAEILSVPFGTTSGAIAIP
jgi:hypothetical protein